MPPIKHARLSASSAHRWLECPPSVRATENIPDTTTLYAEEGTAAHEVAEYKVRRYLGETDIPVPNTGQFDAEEIDKYTDTYLGYVTDKVETIKKSCQDALVLVEQRLDFSNYVPDGFGTGDLVIIADNVMQIIDLKYGKGVAVAADNNPQMMLYALGAINLFGHLYDIKTVQLSIVQPRLDNISEWAISAADLTEWAETVLKPTAQLAAAGEGDFKAGDHCRFCKLKATCRKRAKLMLETAKYDYKPPAELTETEIAEVLKVASQLSKWADDVFAYAQAQAVNNGVSWDGFKLVEGRSVRKYTDENKIADICRDNGYTISQIYKTSLIGITDMERLMGKKKFRELLSEYIVKPKGKLTLVPESDKREEVLPHLPF
nr:MAG TPA: PD-(D/E)XK nuclease superfamily protein [Caudoviricetes sp.]